MLKKNEIYETEFTGYTSEGLGVARIDGMAVFVPKAIAGERCRVRILKVGKTVAYGKIEQVLTPSAHRVKPACPYAGLCGGCAFQHMDYEEECTLKAQRVEDALTRIGGLQLDGLSITGAKTTGNYRTKAQFPVGMPEGKADAGFFRQRSHQVIPIERCGIQSEDADKIRAAAVEWMRKYRVPVYDEVAHSGLVRHIYVRCGFATGQVLACIVANGETLPKEQELVSMLRAAVPNLTTVVLSIHTKKGNAVLGDRFRTLWGEGYIEDILCGLRFRLSPRSFYQVNRDQAERLYEKAIALAELDETKTALDLYCGTGTITLCMAKQAGSVIGVEIIEAAIHDAKENAERNGIKNARFFCADAGEAALRLAEEGTKPDVIMVDPPRKGISMDVIDAMVTMAPQRIVYVSCDPATLARDVKLLEERGYKAIHAEAVDLFPRCAHVESVVCLSREKADDYIRISVHTKDLQTKSN
ncbi:MAG: 23S rRNA (uracil(1939)-C(5))-methyltransferase RlmD [Oscillospiraceae bacterium]|nr:23S rRNA (uracil(1939)-C(5))-methyltransferase RlmD [Oscillospiraceae bacterium]